MPLHHQRGDISIYHNDILDIYELPEETVNLTVTSPPYNLDIPYNEYSDAHEYTEYLRFAEDWMSRCYDLTVPSGRLCLNVPLDKNKGGNQAVYADYCALARNVGWQYRTTIVWNKQVTGRGRTAWGSWLSASAPAVTATSVEMIAVFHKGDWKRPDKGSSGIRRQDFMNWAHGIWTFPAQTKSGAGGHPAPFPVELPRRCIQVFSYIGDTILDPFAGSGSTLIAACATKRKGIGVEIDKEYCDIAVKRLYSEAGLYLI